MSFELPNLPYKMEALQPYMSAETLEYHHHKHHQAYVTKSNDLIKGTGLEGRGIEDVIRQSSAKKELSGLFNNVAQHWNHSFFWDSMTPNGGGTSLPGGIGQKITEDFGSFEAFREQFIQAGMTQFGSGWCWLVLDNGKLSIMKTANADNPIIHGKTALLVCDVWEHAYYIDYRNARPKYLDAFVDHLIDWESVAKRYEGAVS